MDVISNINKEKERTDLTRKLLLCISDHLSTRKECRGKTYRVAIGVRDETQSICNIKNFIGDSKAAENYIFFETPIQVFPNRYNRKDWDKRPVIQHIIYAHFWNELSPGAGSGCMVQIHCNKLIRGIYEYQPSLNNKRRRWVKIK
jgi:hypothetical protein